MAYKGVLLDSNFFNQTFARFNNEQVGNQFIDAVKAATGGRVFFNAGDYFGDQYKVVGGINPNQPGWGQKIEPGWELIGYRGPAQGYGVGQAILQRQGAQQSAPIGPASPQYGQTLGPAQTVVSSDKGIGTIQQVLSERQAPMLQDPNQGRNDLRIRRAR